MSGARAVRARVAMAAALAVLATAQAAAAAPGEVAAQAQAAPPRLELDVELEPGTRRFHAVARISPVARDFRFELHESLAVAAADADGESLRVEAAGRAGTLRGWRVRLPAGAARLRLEYGGTLPPLDATLSERAVLHGLPPMASEEGSFLPASAGWYPAPAALFAYRVSIDVPAGQLAVVPGDLIAETRPRDGAAHYRATFEFAHPADGIDLMAGPWVVRERVAPRAGGAPLRLRTYFTPELDAMPGLAEGYLDDVRRYLERYSEAIGAYPYAGFSVVASPLPTGFGMPTLTYLGAAVLKLPFIRGTSLGHEVLHNWWGNGVYVDYAQGNWSEGLTTFMADYAYKRDESPAAARAMRLAWLRDAAALPSGAAGTLAGFRTRTHGAAAAVGYGKAAMLFVMLEDAIGADAFRRAIRSFWMQQRFRAASWADLRAAFEAASGRSLATFFAQWLDRAGGPTPTLDEARVTGEGGRLRLTLAFEQTTPAYALALPVEIVYPGRSETRRVRIDRPRDIVTLDVDAVPAGVRVDPDLRLWRMLDPAQLPPILRQWIVARAPRLVLASGGAPARDAAAELARRLFEHPARPTTAQALTRGDEPVLLVGLHADVDAMLAGAGLPPRPSALAGRGTAQVWTIAAPATPPVAVVSARDAEALGALAGPLPHYGAQSWLAFDGRRAIDRGIWPAPSPLVPVRVEPSARAANTPK